MQHVNATEDSVHASRMSQGCNAMSVYQTTRISRPARDASVSKIPFPFHILILSILSPGLLEVQ